MTETPSTDDAEPQHPGYLELLAATDGTLRAVVEYHRPHPVMSAHEPSRVGYWQCRGCDPGPHPEDLPDAPCSTIQLIAEMLGVPGALPDDHPVIVQMRRGDGSNWAPSGAVRRYIAAEEAPPKEMPAAVDQSWARVAERLDELSRPVWEAATSPVLDLLAKRAIHMDAGIPSGQPDHLEIQLVEHEDVGALDRILAGLDHAGYEDCTLYAAFGGPPSGAVIARVTRDQVPDGGVLMISVDMISVDRNRLNPVERPSEDAS